MSLLFFIAESNAIEGIHREPSPEEIAAHRAFLALDQITVADMEQFVSAVQPGAILRTSPGCNVTVGRHVPPPGGMAVLYELEDILDHANRGDLSPYEVHCQFETLHPFTDGNGRVGRVLWRWMMRWTGGTKLSFLHA